jgi:hypothetical protein
MRAPPLLRPARRVPTRHARALGLLPLGLLLTACAAGTADGSDSRPGNTAAVDAATALVSDAATGEWRPLFDGRSLDGWHHHQKPGEPIEGWTVEDGALVRSGPGGDIVTAGQYGSFELEFEWQVTPGGNSGVFYRINPGVEVTYVSAPEYQVLDDTRHRDGQSRLTSACAVYGLYPAPEGATQPVGEWNAGRIVVEGPFVQHWLNGTRCAAYELGSDDWEAKVTASKFNDWPPYGRSTRGHIGLQDHGDRVAFRNVRIRELP